MWTLLLAPLALAAPVTFQVNDALVKDRPVEAVRVRIVDPATAVEHAAVTDAAGRASVDLPAGTWQVSYLREGYVPIAASPTAIGAEGGTITAALSPLLESTGDAGHRRVQIVLTWGSEWSDTPDVDAHLLCRDDAEVYFAGREHFGGDGHAVRLDVDDVDWGGPETITLLDPTPGRYVYFVRNFAGRYALGASDVVVRVVVDDVGAGEFRAPTDLAAQDWRPFAALVVEEDGRPRIEEFTPEQLAQGADRASTWAYDTGLSTGNVCIGAFGCMLMGALWPILMVVVRKVRRR